MLLKQLTCDISFDVSKLKKRCNLFIVNMSGFSFVAAWINKHF